MYHFCHRYIFYYLFDKNVWCSILKDEAMKKRFLKIATAMLAMVLCIFQITGCDAKNKEVKKTEQKTESIGYDDNFKLSDADVLISAASAGDEFSTLNFDLTLVHEKYSQFLKDVGAPGDYAIHVFHLRERAPVEGDAVGIDKGEIIYSIYNFVGIAQNKQNKYERTSVWAHRALNEEYKDYAIAFEPPQTDSGSGSIKKRVDYTDEEISTLLAAFNEKGLTFDYTASETSKDIERLRKPLGYKDNILSVKVDVDQNYYNEYALEYQYIYHDLTYETGSGCGSGCGSAINESISERIGTITTGFTSVRKYLKNLNNKGMTALLTFCGSDELYYKALEIIDGQIPLEVQVDYLVQIGFTPFAEKRTKSLSVLTKGYNAEGNEYGAYYELNPASVFAAIEEADLSVSDASSCLGASFWEFEYLGKTATGRPHYLLRYARGASVTVRTTSGGIEQTHYYLDINQSYEEWYKNAIPEGTLTFASDSNKFDVQYENMLEYFFNALLKRTNSVGIVTGGASGTYGFWGIAFVPYEKNITSQFSDMFKTVPDVGSSDVNVSLYSLNFTEWRMVDITPEAYDTLKKIYNMDVAEGTITNFLDVTLSGLIWNQDANKAYMIPFMMSGAGSGTISLNGNINSLDTGTETGLYEMLGYYKLELENQSKVTSVLSVALLVFVVVMIVDRIRYRDYY